MTAPRSGESHRPDIDGLRALAIVPVVLYHFRLGCPGGFVGVDIFFVISGFLICSLILRDQEAGNFSLTGFWERRVRRIFPALAVMVLATVMGGWLLLSAADFARLGTSVAFQALLLSNVYFYGQSLTGAGYFATETETRPLLHTWSLAVEEQFYLFFPLLLVLFNRYRRIPAMTVLAIIGLASLLLGIYQAISPARESAAFYLMPGRAWELLLGAMLAMAPRRAAAGTAVAATGMATAAVRPLVRELAGWVGAVLIGAAVLLYNDHTPFPGAAALPPCLGAALIIFSSESRLSRVGQLLSWKPVVFIGLISYSLYLWHWPLLVFFQGLTSHRDGLPIKALLVGLSVPLSILSWRYVEAPFRRRRLFPRRPQILAFGAATTALLMATGWFISQEHGMIWRPDGRFVRYLNSRSHGTTWDMVPIGQALAGRFIPIGTRQTNAPLDVLVWGDSHAMAMTPLLDELCAQASRNGALAFFSGVAPVLVGGSYTGTQYVFDGRTYDPTRVVLDYIEKKRPKMVIITAAWNLYQATDTYKKQLLETIREVLGSGARVYVIKDVPSPQFDTPRVVAVTSLLGRDLNRLGITPEQLEKRNQDMAETFEQISHLGATVLDPASYFLNREGIYGVIKDDQVLYMDGGHLTVEGAKLLAPLFRPIIVQAD